MQCDFWKRKLVTSILINLKMEALASVPLQTCLCHVYCHSYLCIAIALQTSANIFESTEGCCGKIVDMLALHGLDCSRNAGHIPRHL